LEETSEAAPRRRSQVFSRLLLTAYFIESGLLLLVVPWSAFWERNAFVRGVSWIADAAQSGYARGAISGVGVLLVLAGLVELATLLAGRRQT
jgi:ABC-type transport system involved in cytochrome c biogenesis permease subunit